MGHGSSVAARLDSEASARMKRIPAYLRPTVKRIARDAAYEIYDLMRGYYNNVYPPNADVINGRCDHRTLRKDSWEGSDVHQEIETAMMEAGQIPHMKKKR